MDQTPKRKLPWMRIVLMLSLTLNLVVAGMVLGAWLRHDRGHRGFERSEDRAVLGGGPYLRALDKDDRRAIRESLRQSRDDLRSRRGKMRDLTRQVATVLRADPFDPTQLTALMEQQQRAGAQMNILGQQALVARIGTMSPDARQAFADRLEAMLKRGRNRRTDSSGRE